VCDTSGCVGAWRSLVARTVRVGEVPSSNLGAPIKSPADAGFFVCLAALDLAAELSLVAINELLIRSRGGSLPAPLSGKAVDGEFPMT
jgi:hypothetical protein